MVAIATQQGAIQIRYTPKMNGEQGGGDYLGEVLACSTSWGKGEIEFLPEIRSERYCQKDIPSFRQVFFKLVKVSRQRRPFSLRVLPLILRLLTYSRISFSLKLLWRGISGLSNTSNNSVLLV